MFLFIFTFFTIKYIPLKKNNEKKIIPIKKMCSVSIFITLPPSPPYPNKGGGLIFFKLPPLLWTLSPAPPPCIHPCSIWVLDGLPCIDFLNLRFIYCFLITSFMCISFLYNENI